MPPAARVTDMHVCPMVTGIVPHVGGPILPPCSPTVFTKGLPQARQSDKAVCVGPPDVIVKGSMTVLVNGLQAARIGDMTVHGGVIVKGEPTVIIGDAGGAGGGSGGGAGAGGASGSAGGAVITPATRAGAPGAGGTMAHSSAIADPQAQSTTMTKAAESGAPFCDTCG